MKKRLLLIPLMLLGLALLISACSGGESDEDKITNAIETAATSTDPAVCKETQTLSFMEQTNSGTGKEAEKECEEEAKEAENNPDSVSVSDIKVEGEDATAAVEFEGGNFDGQTMEIALVEEDGDWKLDEMTGFVNFDPAPIIKTLQEQLEKEASIEPRVTSCIVEGLEELPEEEFEKLVIENNSQPIVELAESCE